jgi:hypothetical protein
MSCERDISMVEMIADSDSSAITKATLPISQTILQVSSILLKNNRKLDCIGDCKPPTSDHLTGSENLLAESCQANFNVQTQIYSCSCSGCQMVFSLGQGAQENITMDDGLFIENGSYLFGVDLAFEYAKSTYSKNYKMISDLKVEQHDDGNFVSTYTVEFIDGSTQTFLIVTNDENSSVEANANGRVIYDCTGTECECREMYNTVTGVVYCSCTECKFTKTVEE